MGIVACFYRTSSQGSARKQEEISTVGIILRVENRFI
jgi:hypothetical protein